ncbi:glycoside hydrolase family 99-like domain-containing protein [Thermofilum sp.]|uniref:Uncharacterized protein n=1 Tax=Thermofilum adornatum 1505 TaxID=697581 RepID=A0A3G1A5D0_9CREN|nr:hypothetical protein TCARB_0959 [Thermofilum adornatum 1505]
MSWESLKSLSRCIFLGRSSLRRLAVLAVFFLLVLGLFLVYRFLVGGGRGPVRAPVNVSVATSTGNVSVVDSDGDGIPDDVERVYGTDPYRPNYLFAYALGKLPVEEALLFKNVEDFNDSSRGLVDLYASLPREKRGSIDVAMLLGQILSDNIVCEAERRLFEAKFVNPSRLEIVGLNWTPTRVVLDKVYDINVTFTARDDKTPIAYAELRFIPVEYYYMIEKYGMRPEDYPKVFPPEKERVYNLTPIDGKFDGLEEKFSVQIKDIVGGREYKIVALVRDLAGNEHRAELDLPYIRQYENFGKVLFDKGVIVMAVYLPFDMSSIPRKDDDPLLGRYDTISDIVLMKHVDWATGYGVNVFLLDSQNHWWPGVMVKVFTICRALLSTGQVKVAWLMGPSIRHFTYGKQSGDIPEWAIDLSLPRNNETFIWFVQMLMRFADNENYLRIDGKPVLYIWDEGAFFNQAGTYRAVKAMFGDKLYIIADWFPRIPTMPSDEYFQFVLKKYRGDGLRVVDAFTGWIGLHQVGLNTEEYVNKYEFYYAKQLDAWYWFTKDWGKDFIVTVAPGFDNSYSWGGPQVPLPRGADLFKKRLEIALKYLDPRLPILKIDTWNDWGEWSYFEPTVKEGFAYLETLKSLLEEYIENRRG